MKASLSSTDLASLDALKTYLAQHPESAIEIAVTAFHDFLIVKEQNKMLSAEKRVLQDLLKELNQYNERTFFMSQMDEQLRASLPPEYQLLYQSVAQGLKDNPAMAPTMALGLFVDLLATKALCKHWQQRCDVLEWQRNRLLIFVKGEEE